jgi:hypothetical protein
LHLSQALFAEGFANVMCYCKDGYAMALVQRKLAFTPALLQKRLQLMLPGEEATVASADAVLKSTQGTLQQAWQLLAALTTATGIACCERDVVCSGYVRTAGQPAQLGSFARSVVGIEDLIITARNLEFSRAK